MLFNSEYRASKDYKFESEAISDYYEWIGKECYYERAEEVYGYNGRFRIIGVNIFSLEDEGCSYFYIAIEPIDEHNLRERDLISLRYGISDRYLKLINA